MTVAFDHHAINHMLAALNSEMTPLRAGRHADSDTIFMGGGEATEQDQTALAHFGLTKNYKVIFMSFDPANASAGPTTVHAVVTDGLTQSTVLRNGRLWKNDHRSAAILLFHEINIAIRLDGKGRLVVKQMAARYHDHGYELALDAIVAGAAKKPGRMPVVSSVGSLLTVLDLKTLASSFENAE